MKTVILMASLLGLSNVFAASVNDSWSSLEANRTLQIEWPSAQMTHGVWTGVDFLCLDGNTIRTKKVIEKCTKYAVKPGQNGGVYCAATVKAFGIVNNEVSGTRCVQYKPGKEQDVCVKYEDYSYAQPTSFDVDVLKVVSPKEGTTRHLFTKEYSITDCK